MTERLSFDKTNDELNTLVALIEYVETAPDPDVALKKLDDNIRRMTRRNFLRGTAVGSLFVAAFLLDKCYPLDVHEK